MTTVTTPYGTAEIVGRTPDGALFVRYLLADLSDLGRAEIWHGGPCVFRVEQVEADQAQPTLWEAA